MKLGKRIKDLRKEKNMTLGELSKKTGVALATLSRMENGKMTGTLSSHNKICRALNASITDLYREIEESSKIIDSVPKEKRTEHSIPSNKARYELLVTKMLNKNIMPLMMRLEGGKKTQKEQSGPGVEKFIYMIAGTLETIIGKQTHTLKRGDSLYFDASLPHAFTNKTKLEAEAICIVSPPIVK